MVIYLIILLLLLVLCCAEFLVRKKSHNKKGLTLLLLAAGCFTLFFVSAMRLNTGYDYPGYVRTFVHIGTIDFSELSSYGNEKGYVLLNWAVHAFTQNFQAIIVVTAFIAAALVGIILFQHSSMPLCGLTMFYMFGYYFNSMNFIRNLTAALIILFAYKYIRNGDFARFCVIVVLASLFHFSALLVLPFYFILRIKMSPATLAVYAVGGGIIYAFSTPIMEFITKYVYTAYNPQTSIHMFAGIPAIYALCLGAVFISAFLCRDYLEKDGKWGTILISASFFGFYFELIGSKHSILGRFTMFFGIIVSLVLIPELMKIIFVKLKSRDICCTREKIRLYSCAALVCVSAVTFFAYSITHNYNGAVPHNWIWNLEGVQ